MENQLWNDYGLESNMMSSNNWNEKNIIDQSDKKNIYIILWV